MIPCAIRVMNDSARRTSAACFGRGKGVNVPDAGKLYIRLYDTERGGPPHAFQCIMPIDTSDAIPTVHSCNRVTRTERGMLAHLWLVHGIKRQMELNL